MENLTPLIDGDIIRYELGFACETGWREITKEPEAIPPWEYVERSLLARLDSIQKEVGSSVAPVLYFTTGRTFRYDLAVTKPYKAQRKVNKPWHFDNITMYLKDILNAIEVTGIEADDALAIDHVKSDTSTILCTRDKDLRQVPGWFYSWELWRQPSFGPLLIDKLGSIELSDNHKKLKGTGLSFFYGQVLTGDSVDNIPGLKGCGPVAAYEMLVDKSPEDMLDTVRNAYDDDELLLEQGRLCWMVRDLHDDGSPVLWEIGKTE